jgi:hypothetical protein
MVYPVIVGEGRHLLTEETAATGLKLTRSQITSSGVAILTYQPAGDASA